MALATAESIRDRIRSLLESISPASLTTKLISARNEEAANFEEWCEKNPAAAFRRFQVREIGEDEPPLVSHFTVETVRVRYRIAVAYPQTHRYGPQNAMDRDDVMNQDWTKIKNAITGTGASARGNFASVTDGQYDCTPLAQSTKTREAGGKIDYLVILVDFEYTRGT